MLNMSGHSITNRILAMSLCVMALASSTFSFEAGARGNKELIGNAAGLSRESFASAMKDGKPLIDNWLKASEAYNSYQFNYQMTCFKKSGQVTDTGNLYFKKKRLLRIEQTGGPKKGSVAVLQADGKVRAHAGGALKFFAASLSPDSDMLLSANDWPMVKSDFVSLAEAVEGYIKNDGDYPRMSETPVQVPGRAEKVNVFELYKGGATGTLFKRALFDPETNLPVEWWDYRDGTLWAHSTWSNFKATNLSDNVFTLKGDK
jgi:outer membrane lipoprotein-sorting protein